MSRSRDRAKGRTRQRWVFEYLVRVYDRMHHAHKTPEPADRGEDAEIAGSG